VHSALFFVKIPSVDQTIAWEDFTKRVDEKLKREKGVLRLAENVWLLNLRESVLSLGVLLGHADQKKFEFGVLPFERAPEWLPDGFDPKTS
jgi:hypothetical protein